MKRGPRLVLNMTQLKLPAKKDVIESVNIFVLIHKATPVDKPQLSYMVNKIYKTISYNYKTLNEF